MNKLTISILVLVAVGIGIYAFRAPLLQAVSARLTSEMFVSADEDSFDPGIAVGETFPGIRARHEGRIVTEVSQFLGPNGMVFFANRSVDWWPYCIKQLVQLQEHLEQYERAGLGVVALTYDPVDEQAQFVQQYGIEYPVLSDMEASSVEALGILNEEYAPGDSGYGIPYPGAFVLDESLTVRAKIFVAGYETRVDARNTLSVATEALDIRQQQ